MPLVSLECVLEIDYGDQKMASIVKSAIELENDKYATSFVTGRILVVKTSSHSILSILHTLEDLLSCMKAAEEVVRLSGILSTSDPLPHLDRNSLLE